MLCCAIDCRLGLAAIKQTHNTSLYSELCQRLLQATGDDCYSVENDSVSTFITVTNRKAAIMVWIICTRIELASLVHSLFSLFVCTAI